MVRIARAVLVVATVVVLAAAFVPWSVSGSVARDSFATVRSARSLGLGGPAWADTALGAWYFLPALALVVVLAAFVRRDRLAGAAGVLVGGAAVALAGGVQRSPLPAGAGVAAGMVAGAVAAGAGLVLVVWARWDENRQGP